MVPRAGRCGWVSVFMYFYIYTIYIYITRTYYSRALIVAQTTTQRYPAQRVRLLQSSKLRGYLMYFDANIKLLKDTAAESALYYNDWWRSQKTMYKNNDNNNSNNILSILSSSSSFVVRDTQNKNCPPRFELKVSPV